MWRTVRRKRRGGGGRQEGIQLAEEEEAVGLAEKGAAPGGVSDVGSGRRKRQPWRQRRRRWRRRRRPADLRRAERLPGAE